MKKRLLIALFSLILSIAALTGCGSRESAEKDLAEEPFTGLRIALPEDASIILYSGFSDKIQYKLPEPVLRGEMKFYDLPDITPGLYSYTSYGRGYYRFHKALAVTPEKLEKGFFVQAYPGRVLGGGFEQLDQCNEMTEEIMASAERSDPDSFPDYKWLFGLPTFTNMKREKGSRQVTTSEQMEDFLRQNLKDAKNAYRFFLGTSPKYGMDIPLVIFTNTDLSEKMNFRDAAGALKASGLPTVLYTAGIHGNEPAGRDGALAWIEYFCSGKGSDYLNAMNILIVPCQNPDGAKDYSRKESAHNLDMNRDQLRCTCEELQCIHQLYYAILPEVVIDGHEYRASHTTSETEFACADALLSTGGTANTGEALLDLGIDILQKQSEHLRENGLSCRPYPRSETDYSTVNAQNPTTGRCYYSLTGAATFLIETPGINVSTSHYGRRVVTQFIAVEGILDYVKEKGGDVRKTVEAERAALKSRGKTYSEDQLFVLSTDKGDKTYNDPYPSYNAVTGQLTEEKNFVSYCTTVPLETVPLPTAYVIPADLPQIVKITEVLRDNAIEYEKLEKGTVLKLSQIDGSAIGKYTEEREVAFPEGAYLLRMDQLSGNLLAFLMEPDAPDALDYACSLWDMGYVSAEADLLPIYRSREPNP